MHCVKRPVLQQMMMMKKSMMMKTIMEMIMLMMVNKIMLLSIVNHMNLENKGVMVASSFQDRSQ